MLGVREGRGLDKGVVGFMVSVLAGVEVVGVYWEKGRVTYRVEELWGLWGGRIPGVRIPVILVKKDEMISVTRASPSLRLQ